MIYRSFITLVTYHFRTVVQLRTRTQKNGRGWPFARSVEVARTIACERNFLGAALGSADFSFCINDDPYLIIVT